MVPVSCTLNYARVPAGTNERHSFVLCPFVLPLSIALVFEISIANFQARTTSKSLNYSRSEKKERKKERRANTEKSEMKERKKNRKHSGDRTANGP